MCYWDDGDYFEPGEFDEKIEELKNELRESVKKEIKKNIISFREFVFYSLPVVFSAVGIFVFRKKEMKGDRGCEK